jgi:hypothetical protein
MRTTANGGHMMSSRGDRASSDARRLIPTAGTPETPRAASSEVRAPSTTSLPPRRHVNPVLCALRAARNGRRARANVLDGRGGVPREDAHRPAARARRVDGGSARSRAPLVCVCVVLSGARFCARWRGRCSGPVRSPPVPTPHHDRSAGTCSLRSAVGRAVAGWRRSANATFFTALCGRGSRGGL